MKKSKRNPEPAKSPAETVAPGRVPWWLGLVLAAAAVAAYLPALGGPFLFDDFGLPMLSTNVNDTWVSFLTRGVRAVTNLSLLADKTLWGLNPAPYHFINLLLHLVNGWLVFGILRKLLARAGREEYHAALGAAFGAGLFLLHPLQTEAVAYIASRSEVLCAFFSYAACLVFLSSGDDGIEWGRALGVLVLLALGMASKEPAVAMAAVFLLIDLWFSEKLSLREVLAKWKLYTPMFAGGVVAAIAIFRIVGLEGSAGATAGISPMDYLMTQFKAVWVYVRMFAVPFGQNLDHAFPVTRAPGDALSWLGMLAVIVVCAAAVFYRRRYPVATLGALMFLLLLAPTSSIVPIADTLVERRVYLGSIGLAAIGAELVSRMKRDHARTAALAALLVVLGVITMVHNNTFTSARAMWQASVASNPGNARAQFQLADAYYRDGQCQESLSHFDAAARLNKPDYRLLVNWGLALDCAGNAEGAIAKLRQATQVEHNSHAWGVMGMVYAKRSETDKALDALNRALQINPGDEAARVYRGNVFVLIGQPSQALPDYEEALRINPSNEAAMQGKQAALRARDAAK